MAKCLIEIARILRRKVWTHECRTLWHDGYYLFDVINYATWHELVLSRYGNGAFYKPHQDTLFHQLPCRLVSLVYYVARVPKEFTGGALVIWHGRETFRVYPQHNLAVLFPLCVPKTSSDCYAALESPKLA